MNLSIKMPDAEFLLDGYISSDNNEVSAAIFMTVVPGINGDFCLGAYYGYAGGGDNDGGFLASTLKIQYINILILMNLKRCVKAMFFITQY